MRRFSMVTTCFAPPTMGSSCDILEFEAFKDGGGVRVSVVIPVYDGAHTLGFCLEALKRSARLPDECIVVDDGSSDCSAEIAANYGATVVSTGDAVDPLAPGIWVHGKRPAMSSCSSTRM